MKTFCFLGQSIWHNHPQEDFFCCSSELPIFCVADGVTLCVDKGGDYPKESGAGQAAKLFCQAAVSAGERLYSKFSKNDILETFLVANDAVRQYNLSCGLRKETINFWDKDFFSVTTAFGLVKNNKIYWWSLCDSGLALFDSKGGRRFSSPDGWHFFKKNIPQNWDQLSKKNQTIILHRDFRNTLNPKLGLQGYGVADGEECAKYYLNTGVLPANPGDKFFIYTDGFENYFRLEEFIEMFLKWPDDLQSELAEFVSLKAKEDPKKFGAEKTLIAVSF